MSPNVPSISFRSVRTHCLTALGVLAMLLATPTWAQHSLVLDQASSSRSLDGATADGRWIMGDGLLGGEREEGLVDGAWAVTWDGIDNDPSALDTSGLGGVDLTARGQGNGWLATWHGPLTEAGWIEVEVWSHSDRRSTARIEVPSGASFVTLPFGKLQGNVDLSAVGALRLTVGPGTQVPTFSSLAVALAAPYVPPATTQNLGPAPIPATLVLQDGDMPTGGGGNAVTSLNSPFVNTLGQVGFTGNLNNGGSSDGFIFLNDQIIQLNSTTMGAVLTGGESTMGVSDAGGFFYSPSIDGDDGVWSQNGQVAVENVQAPGFPGGTNSTFHSRPTMIPTGAAYWVSGFDDTGGTSTQGRMIYTSSDATAANVAVVLRSDDLVDGTAIDRPSGIDFDYDFSDDGSHHIQVLLLDTGGTTDDGRVWVDGTVIAAETGATGDGDNWDNFDAVAINDSGNFLFSGDTDGDTATDEFIAYNGAINIRQGDVLDGVTLETSVQFISLNNGGQAIHAWTGEHLFFACDASDLAGTSRRMLSTGDSVDLDGDGTGDGTVTDLNTSGTVGPTYGLTRDNRVFVEVDLDTGGGDMEAVLELQGPACGLVINEVDYDQAVSNDEEFIELYNGSGDSVNLDAYTVQLVNGDGGGAVVYTTLDLPDVDLAAGDFYVICGDAALVPACDLDVTPDTDLIENGAPDAVALVIGAVLVDTVSYEGDTGAPYTEGSGVGLEDDPATDFFSISRLVDGADTDQNNVDFGGRCNSPGEANFSTTNGCVQVPVELMSFTIE